MARTERTIMEIASDVTDVNRTFERIVSAGVTDRQNLEGRQADLQKLQDDNTGLIQEINGLAGTDAETLRLKAWAAQVGAQFTATKNAYGAVAAKLDEIVELP